MAWLDDLLCITEEAESPSLFIYWAGLAAISAVVKKNLYLDKHFYKLYPNIYVMLVAKSGGRKGLPISIAKGLVETVNNTKLISGRNSIQAIIKDLSKAYTKEDGQIIKDATCFICSEEFTTLVIDDDSALSILTTLYDTHAHEKGWTNTLKGDGQEKLHNVYVTMLAASNQTHFKDKVTSVDFTGGFVGRMLMVVDDNPRKINPLIVPPTKPFDLTPLANYLNDISKLKGQFKWTGEGAALFADWYQRFRSLSHDDTTGTTDRLHDQILKVAMLLSLSKRLTLTLEKEDIEDAIAACTDFSSNVQRINAGVGKSQFGSQTATLINYLLGKVDYSATKKQVLSRFWGEMDTQDVDRIVMTMVDAGALEQPKLIGKEVKYRLTNQFVTEWKNAKKVKESNVSI